MKFMNDLTNYGIEQERTDIRIHVCVRVKRLYVYSREAALLAIRTHQYAIKSAYQDGMKTAEGYAVPWNDIADCREVWLHGSYWRVNPIRDDMSTTEKGAAAAHIVSRALQGGYVPLPMQVLEVTDRATQIDGVDLVTRCALRLQVKCDFHGGERKFGGTGNLFIQLSEANPYQRH